MLAAGCPNATPPKGEAVGAAADVLNENELEPKPPDGLNAMTSCSDMVHTAQEGGLGDCVAETAFEVASFLAISPKQATTRVAKRSSPLVCCWIVSCCLSHIHHNDHPCSLFHMWKGTITLGIHYPYFMLM